MILTLEREVLLRRAIRLWEPLRHWGQVMEECAELIVAIRHRARGRITDEEVAEEVADVLIVVEKVRLILGPEMVDNAIERKLARFEKRIAEEEKAREAGQPPKDF